MGEGKYSTYEIRVRAVRALKQGMSMSEVARAYQTHRSTIHRWLERHDAHGGDAGLARRPVNGRPRVLGSFDEGGLRSIVLSPASEFGYETDFWTCGRLAQVIRRRFRKKVSKWTVWRRLREAGLTYQKPERRYLEANDEDRQRWIKSELPKIRRTVKQFKAILYFEDESNISLTAFLAKTWAPRGQTPTQKVTGKRGGVAAMSAISKRGSLVFTLLEKRIVSDDVIHFLDQLLQHHKRRHLVVVMDQASPHTSKKTQAFIDSRRRLHVFHLPPYSPDWNPDEQVWNHLKHQELKGHGATTRGEMKALARKKLAKMAKDPETLRGIFFRCYVAELLH